MPSPAQFSCQKSLFDIPADVTYLNAAYMTPILASSALSGQRAVAAKLQPWQTDTRDFFDPPARACALMAQMIGARADDIALIPAVSYGMAIAARNLSLRPGQKIIILADQFPSNVYPWQQMAQSHQATVVTINRPENGDWTARLLEAIDHDTAIVACPQAHWTDGTRVDLVPVGQACRRYGAALVLDLTQSLGVMPFSVRDVDPDFMIVASYKWLLGPYSYAFVYVAPRHQQGTPLEDNWIVRTGSEDFTRLVDYQPDYQPGAARFNVGERSNFMLTPIVVDGLEQLNQWGVDRISSYLSGLTGLIAERAQAIGLTVAAKACRSPHLIGLNFTGDMPEGVTVSLAQRKIYVSVRGNSIRVAPHIYNDAQDIDRLFSALGELI
ncbi:MAG: aminotransferase class V-fold PLP-dependent enzyme [Alphaproteobacteria bacterium]|nr:aminotransferase class V-fold PLP-dependent enzyme [Alphaproteobacteria bacterium]